MSKFLDYTWWLIIAYPIAGLIILFLMPFSTEHSRYRTLLKITEIINIIFGIWLLILLINSLLERKETTGKYLSGEIEDWFSYVPLFLISFLISFKKLRRTTYSILLFSLIILLENCLTAYFDTNFSA